MADQFNALSNGNDFPKIGTRGLNPGESILNPDGTRSSERTISVGFDDGVHVIPTIIIDEEGFLVKVSNEDAIELFRQGKNPSRGIFKSVEEANEFAGQRSASGGRDSTLSPKKVDNALVRPRLNLPIGRL